MSSLRVYFIVVRTYYLKPFDRSYARREDGNDVAQRSLHSRGNYNSAQRARVDTVEPYDENDFDDAEPVRMHSSTLRYPRKADVRAEVGRAPADVQVLSSQGS